MFEELRKNPVISEFWNPSELFSIRYLPKTLHHYTPSIKAIENILSTGELWLSRSTVMNDFSEIKYGCELFLKIAKEESEHHKELETIIKAFEDTLADDIFSDIFLFSFSENGNSRHLWNSYSGESGYKIEFSNILIEDFMVNSELYISTFNPETKKMERKKSGPKIAILSKKNERSSYGFNAVANPVLYDRQKQVLLFKEILNSFIKAHALQKVWDTRQCLWTILEIIPFFKDENLRDEEEYRLMIQIHNAGQNNTRGKKPYLRSIQHYREVNNKLFSYIIIKMYEKTYIKSVSIGDLNNDELTFNTLQDFISTLPNDIAVKKNN